MIASGKLDLRGNRIERPFLWKKWKRARAAIRFALDSGLDLTDRAHATVCLERRGKELVLTRSL